MRHDRNWSTFSDPENPLKVRGDASRALAMTAPGEQATLACRGIASQYELILVPTAMGAGFPLQFAANLTDFSQLFLSVAGAATGWLFHL